MTFAFDSTVKGATANSYISVAEADDIAAGHWQSATWTDLSTEDKERFLVQATSRLDLETFEGQPTTQTPSQQALQWPRSYIVNRNFNNVGTDWLMVGGNYYRDQDTIPREVKLATFEMAIHYVREYNEDPTASRNDIARMNSLSIGPLNMSFRSIAEDALPDSVKRYLIAIGPTAWKGGNGNVALVR